MRPYLHRIIIPLEVVMQMFVDQTGFHVILQLDIQDIYDASLDFRIQNRESGLYTAIQVPAHPISGSQEKEKLKRNKEIVCRWQKERHEYARQVKRLEEDLLHSASESEQYKERMSDLEFYQQKLRESERIISSLSAENADLSDMNVLSMLVQLKDDPLHTNLTREEWNDLFHLTDILFNHILTDLKDQQGITRHEQEICCLVKWNFSRKEQLAVFNNTSEALTKSKNQLKKKLRLDEKADLDQFIRLY